MRHSSLFSVLICIAFYGSCTTSSNKLDSTPVSYQVPISSNKCISYNSFALDSVLLESFPTSFVGFIYITDRKILFIDENFCWVFEFDSSGKYISRHIGKGKKPNELPIKKVSYFAPTATGGYFFIGTTWDCFVFDKNFQRIDDYELNWHPTTNNIDKDKNPDPSKTDVYTLAYSFSKILIDSNTVYLPLFAQARTFNPTSDSYASNTRVLATMDIRDGYINEVMGRLSPIYSKNRNIQTMTYLNFDLVPGNEMYFTYPADSLIYLSDRQFHILKKFGSGGRSMNENYFSIDNLMNFWKIWHQQELELGYYHSIKYIPEKHLLFRSYQKGESPISDGLQIYKNDTLISDVDVPRGFNVVGYISPFFYSNAFINEEKGTVTIYKFQLN
jgi:hypothetical protein